MSRGDERNVLEEIKQTFGDDLNILLVYVQTTDAVSLILNINLWFNGSMVLMIVLFKT